MKEKEAVETFKKFAAKLERQKAKVEALTMQLINSTPNQRNGIMRDCEEEQSYLLAIAVDMHDLMLLPAVRAEAEKMGLLRQLIPA